MAQLPEDLQQALDAELGSLPPSTLVPIVERLSQRYRSSEVPHQPILRTANDAKAYAGYRMPATFAAVSSGLAEFAALKPDFQPRTLLDIGGGTGAAVWAATELWSSLESITVVEQSGAAIDLGSKLAARARNSAVRATQWTNVTLEPGAAIPAADIAVLSYVLGELEEASRTALMSMVAPAASVVAVFEAGTPPGYQRILVARQLLIEAGFSLVAPCPQNLDCPIARDANDWCHFNARINRTSLHRRLKTATLGYEDEKFSYVIAARSGSDRAENRVLRHPLRRKGLVQLRLCTKEGEVEDRIVSRRQGNVYRAARDTNWGDAWPPSPSKSED